jgi:hypothetical protein
MYTKWELADYLTKKYVIGQYSIELDDDGLLTNRKGFGRKTS